MHYDVDKLLWTGALDIPASQSYGYTHVQQFEMLASGSFGIEFTRRAMHCIENGM